MVPLMPGDREKGRKVMEKSLTPRQRVFRRLKAGRPKQLGFTNPDYVEVVYILFRELERARAVMEDEKVPLSSLRWEIRYYPRNERPTLRFILSPREKHWPLSVPWARALFFELDRIVGEDPLFLSIDWTLNTGVAYLAPDGDTEEPEWDEEVVPDWRTRFNSYPDKVSEITEALAAQKKD